MSVRFDSSNSKFIFNDGKNPEKTIDKKQVAKLINTLAEDGNSEAVRIRNAAFGQSWGSIWRTEDVARIRCAISNNEAIRDDIAKLLNKNPKFLETFKVGIFSKNKMRLCKSKLLKASMECRKRKVSTQMDQSFARLAKVHSSADNIKNIFDQFASNVAQYVPKNDANKIMRKMGGQSEDLGFFKESSQEAYRKLDNFKNDSLDYDGTTKLDRLVKLGGNSGVQGEYERRIQDCNIAANFSNDFKQIASLANDIINSASVADKKAVRGLVMNLLNGLVSELGQELPQDAITNIQGTFSWNSVDNATEHAGNFSKSAVNALKQQFKEQCGIDYDANSRNKSESDRNV